MKNLRFLTAATALAYSAGMLSALACSNTSANDVTGPSVPSVIVTSLQFVKCERASPSGGEYNCRGTANLTVNSPPSRGFLTVSITYPDPGSFYHGQQQVPKAGGYQVSLINEFIPRCVPSVDTTADVYDGPASAAGTLLVKQPFTITRSCSSQIAGAVR